MITKAGRYKIRLDETMLVLTHPAGISFDLTLQEAGDLLEFLALHQDRISNMLAETDPLLKRVVLEQEQVRSE